MGSRRSLLRTPGYHLRVAPVRALFGVPGLTLAAVLLILGVMGMILYGSAGSSSAVTATGQIGVVCTSDPAAGSVAGFTGVQLDNAAVIVAVGQALHVPQRGLVIGVATAMQESTLHNLNHGDIMANGQMSSSEGLFQQLQTYGPDRTVPARAAQMFFGGGPGGIPGLLQIPGWQSMPLAQAAEAVQLSQQPELYTQWEQPANEVVGKVENRACQSTGAATGGAGASASGVPPVGVVAGESAAAAGAVKRALAEVGVAYSWGGGDNNGPTLGICGPDGAQNDCHIVGFDCSGLTMYAYAGVGIQTPHQTQLIWAAFPTYITDRSQLLPGDLLLISSDGAPDGIHHVAIYLGGDSVVEAPESGALVRVTGGFWESGNGAHFLGAVRPGGV